MCGHGGDSSDAPPNSARAFQTALQDNVPCMEVGSGARHTLQGVGEAEGGDHLCTGLLMTAASMPPGSPRQCMSMCACPGDLVHTFMQVDVARTKDGRLVVLHARELAALTGTSGKQVRPELLRRAVRRCSTAGMPRLVRQFGA